MATNTEEIIVKFRTEGGHEIEETFRRAGDAGEKFHQSISRHIKTNTDFLESQRRVRNNIGELAQSFAQGSSATDLFQQSVSRLSEVFRIGLGPGIATGVGIALYSSIQKAYNETVKLFGEIRDVSRFQGDFRSLETIESHLDAINQKRQALLSLRESPGHLLGMGALELLYQGTQQFTPRVTPGPFQEESKEIRQLLAQLSESERRDVEAIAKQEERITNTLSNRLSGNVLEADLEENKLNFLLKQADVFDKLNKPGAYKELAAVLDQIAKQLTIANETSVKQDELQKLQVSHAKDLLDIQHSGLGAEQQRVALLLKEVEYQEQLANRANQTDRERAQNRANLQRAQQQLPADLQIQPLLSEQNEVFNTAGRAAQSRRLQIAATAFSRNTQEGRTDEYYRQFNQRTRDYYQNLEDQTDLYNLSVYGRLNRPATASEIAKGLTGQTAVPGDIETPLNLIAEDIGTIKEQISIFATHIDVK